MTECVSELLETIGVSNYEVIQTFGTDGTSISTNDLSCSMISSESVTFLGAHFAQDDAAPVADNSTHKLESEKKGKLKRKFDSYSGSPYLQD